MDNLVIGLDSLLSAYLGTATPPNFMCQFTMLILTQPRFTEDSLFLS
uniref:Uncharacterized protein n=1 Tax=Siphoviridae sp. ctv0N24 TaxID=2826509 RepID=A0A8S5N3H9_9CAUD|nr:MAG TPA: hypothetical protein [Siphoviridae sp. ctv0N24]